MSDGDGLCVAVDVGTTGARACAVDLHGTVVLEAQRPYETRIPQPGRAEQDPREWRQAALDALRDLAGGITGRRVVAVGLTGQCPTIAPCDRQGEPVGPGLLYRDNRAELEAGEMRERIGAREMHDRTGHVAEAFHVGPKVLWMRRHAPEVYAAAELFLQPRDVVLHALTGVIATDETHANSTVFFDLVRRDWALDLLEAFDLEPALFPPVHPPWAVVGEINAGIDGLDGSPVVIGSADSQCAQYGNGVLEPGPVSEMSGASSCLNTVVLAPLRDERVTHYSFLVPGCYSTELGVNTTGAALRWVVDQLGFADFAELEAAAERGRLTIRAAAGDPRQLAPLFLPYLGDGERTDAALRSAFIGLSDRHSRAELAYAALEGVAFAVIDTIDVLRHAGSAVDELVTSGGAARLATLGAIKADALDRPVRHLAHDSARVGIALFAAAQVGYGAQATAALAANTSSALVHEPDPALREAVAARHAWFREVRASPTVRVGA